MNDKFYTQDLHEAAYRGGMVGYIEGVVLILLFQGIQALELNIFLHILLFGILIVGIVYATQKVIRWRVGRLITQLREIRKTP